ncbi:MAG: type II and III secretion system protein family protein [Hyphomicrobiaceae bacterium]|nr:type II and III secretion system protein family protein [Hyphomicrobiaceae bacterium]
MRKYQVPFTQLTIIFLSLCLMVLGIINLAKANTKFSSNEQRDFGIHQSVLKVDWKKSKLVTKTITLALNKSIMIEIEEPRKLKDLIISNPKMIQAVVKTSNRVYLVGKLIGQTNIFFFDDNGDRFLTLEVQIDIDTRPLDTMLRRFIPGSKIITESLNDTLVLTGNVRSPSDSSRAVMLAERFAIRIGETSNPNKVINMLIVEGEEQVMLRVKFAEVQRSIIKELGINVSSNFIDSDSVLTVLSNTRLTSSYNIKGILASGAHTLDFALKALERNGLVRTLAEPNLTAVSGEQANFLAGGEFPIPVSTQNGQPVIDFKEYGVGLVFTPTVLSEGRISLKIFTEVTELTNIGAVVLSEIKVPALTKRKTESTVELPSGGTLAMSGLVQNFIQKDIEGFPGLKQLPILGSLFRSTDFQKRETELIVMVTPYVVRPAEKRDISAPTDGLIPADDKKIYLLGHLNRIHGRSVTLPDGSLKDSYGFIVD